MVQLDTEHRLRYEPMRPYGRGWSLRLRVERLAADGEWEPLAVGDTLLKSAGAFGNPDHFIRFERGLCAKCGLDRRRLPIVASPCTLMSETLRLRGGEIG